MDLTLLSSFLLLAVVLSIANSILVVKFILEARRANSTSKEAQKLKSQNKVLQLVQAGNQEVIEAANEKYAKYLSDLEKEIAGKIEKLTEETSKDLKNNLQKVQKDSFQIKQEAVQSINQELTQYKKEKIEMIDENIVGILEKTLSLVLTRRLTLKDHEDLVRDALSQARSEKFLP
ncbi:MAG: hypothetical protein HYW33_01580 [Candidatus Blackburnbacteria bacterium]|nr:hypothetical protein [Candidatus Blackburnbacteria bacterium]